MRKGRRRNVPIFSPRLAATACVRVRDARSKIGLHTSPSGTNILIARTEGDTTLYLLFPLSGRPTLRSRRPVWTAADEIKGRVPFSFPAFIQANLRIADIRSTLAV